MRKSCQRGRKERQKEKHQALRLLFVLVVQQKGAQKPVQTSLAAQRCWCYSVNRA
ncbi:hypothetical protein J40TS1_10570 [Paenibacillus montaniterrae]|uniref:Uncharacterized protein n=1 Tax=Paenibacillus montaniterrae TaxID=429341 RepID=A0A919YLI2_9BACL|nr:hypothetical protein J40TS1_10570 [Paenibacillus montaniterrae]